MERMRPEPRPMKRRVSSSRYSTARFASKTSLEAARRAMPTSFGGGSDSNNMRGTSLPLYIRLFFAVNVKPLFKCELTQTGSGSVRFMGTFGDVGMGDRFFGCCDPSGLPRFHADGHVGRDVESSLLDLLSGVGRKLSAAFHQDPGLSQSWLTGSGETRHHGG